MKYPEQAIEIGHWMNSLEDDVLCLPQELPKINPADKPKVLRFLSAGTVFQTYRGYEWCRFLCGVPHEQMGHSDLINGDWIYPEGLLHYVDVHNVAVPPQLLIAASGNSQTSLDKTLWSEFCAAHFNLELRQFLNSLRIRFESDANAAINAACDTLDITRGLSDSQCTWAACDRLALKGMVLCSRHWSPDSSLIRADYAHRAFSDFLDRANKLR